MNTTTERLDVRECAVRLAPHLSALAASALRWRVHHYGDDRDDSRDHAQLVVTTEGPETAARLYLSADGGRIHVSGCFPMLESGRIYSPPGKDDYGRITLDAKRDAKVLAREIERRCFSVYLPAYRQAMAYVARDGASRKGARDAAAIIAATAGCEPRKQGGGDGVDLFPSTPGCYRVQIHPGHDTAEPHVSMQLEHVSPAQAVAVLALLKGGAS